MLHLATTCGGRLCGYPQNVCGGGLFVWVDCLCGWIVGGGDYFRQGLHVTGTRRANGKWKAKKLMAQRSGSTDGETRK